MLALAALLATVSAAEPLRLAALDFTGSGVSADRATFFSEHFAAKLAEQSGVRVSTRAELQAIVGVAKQRELLGCSGDGSDCTAELAGALNADAFITGQVAKIGGSYQLNVKLISVQTGRPLFVYTSELLPREEDVIADLNRLAPTAVRAVNESLGRSTFAGRWPRLLPAAAGIAAVAGGAISLSIASQRYAELTNRSGWATLAPTTARADATTGQQSLALGLTLGIAGVAAIAAGLLWFWLVGT